MGIIALIISLLLLFISSNNKKSKVSNPMVFFYLLWSFILFLSCLNLYNMHKPSDEAYLLIMLMEIFFYVGSLFALKKNTSSLYNLTDDYINDNKCFRVLYILGLSIIVFNFIDLIIVLKEYVSGTPMWQIRNWALQPYGSINPLFERRSFIEETIRTIILGPSQIIIYASSAYYLFNGRKKQRKRILMLISAVILITSSIAGGGGRLGVVSLVLCLFLSYYTKVHSNYKDDDVDMIHKYKNIMRMMIFLGIFTIILYTCIRTGPGALFKQFYTYFAMSPTLLSEWLPMIKEAGHTYGFLTFYGFHSYFFRILGMIGSENVPAIYDLSYTYVLNAEKFINIGSGISNAFVSPIYYFYLDGGYPFIIGASSFFGYVISRFYNKYILNVNIKSFSFYILIMYALFVSFMRIQTAIPAFIFSFIIVLIVYKKKEK